MGLKPRDVGSVLPADAGAMVNQAIWRPTDPWPTCSGIGNVPLARSGGRHLRALPASALEAVPPDLQLDRSTASPIDTADVCPTSTRRSPRPTCRSRTLDVCSTSLAGTLVVENPATSSPGLAFLLATIAAFGEDPEHGWQAFWRGLRDNGVQVTAGWEEAYYGSFSGGSGEGDRPIVISYASSPAAEVVFGSDPERIGSHGALDVGCYQQVEFIGILLGTDRPELAAALISTSRLPRRRPSCRWRCRLPARSDVRCLTSSSATPSSRQRLSLGRSHRRRPRVDRQWTDIVLR
jgi:thiamine transport system substrate-binding protein